MVFRRLIRPLRRLSAEFFYGFGLHCAKNIIRVILISDIVITSLFYPALAIYFSSQPLSHYSTRLHASIFAFNERADAYRTDLREVWEVLDNVRIREDSAAQARCGSERTVRIETVFVSSVKQDDVFGALNKDTLLATLDLQRGLNQALISAQSEQLYYLRDPAAEESPQPLMFGPPPSWHAALEALPDDLAVIHTINTAQNVTKAGLPVNKDFYLANRGPVDEHGFVNEAEYLALTYFFVESDCQANTRHAAWVKLLESIAGKSGDVATSTSHPTLVALQYDTAQVRDSVSYLSIILYICYLVIFVHFSGAMRRIDTVHSRFGLAFTGVVEIIASTITSVSVCALWGFRITMVPWAILPVMIVFIGAEDMFILIQSVVSTPVTLPIQERLAQGMSRAGTSNTFKVVAYNAIFGSMAYFTTGAIKQFCIFTVVVLVAHWFLIHTFFVAVLAIDIQRLELSDLLHQGPRVHSTAPSPAREKVIEEVTAMETKGRWRFFRRDQAAKNGSLFVILSLTAMLYYTSLPASPTLPAVASRKASTEHPFSFSHSISSARPTAAIVEEPYTDDFHPYLGAISPSAEFWRTFNPEQDSLLHLRIESPVIVNPRPLTSAPDQSLTQKRRPISRTIRRLTWLFRIVVLPMSATALALYGLLLYLLKDAQLLDAQRDKPDGTVPDTELEQDAVLAKGKPLEGLATFVPLSRAFIAEVDLIAMSRDGSTVASISTERELSVWKLEEEQGFLRESGRKATSLSLLTAGLSDPQLKEGTPTAIALDDNGSRCVIGLSNGLVLQWSLADGLRGRSSSRTEASPLVSVSFIPAPSISMSASASTIKPSDVAAPISPSPVVAGLLNGSVYLWSGENEQPAKAAAFSGQLVGVPSDVNIDIDGSVTVASLLQGSSLEVLISQPGAPDGSLEWFSKVILQTEGPDEVACVKWSTFALASRQVEIVGVASKRGRLTIYDCLSGHVMCDLYDQMERIQDLRFSPISAKRCEQCKEFQPDGFLLSFTSGSAAHIYRAAALEMNNGRCSCGIKQLQSRRGSKTGLRDRFHAAAQRSRNSSTSASSSPMMHRSSLPGGSSRPTNLDYPLPPHHSRRASEKEVKGRVSTETTSDATDWDVDSSINDSSFGPLNVPSVGESSSLLHLVIPERNIRLIKVAEIPCDRGPWEMTDSVVFGVRRRPRMKHEGKVNSKLGSDTSLFTRWEAWSFNVLTGELRSAGLPELDQQSHPMTSQANGSLAPPRPENGLVQRSPALKRLIELAASRPSQPTISPSIAPTSHIVTQRPALPFTRVTVSTLSDSTFLMGMGNTPCILNISGLAGLPDDTPLIRQESTSVSSSLFSLVNKKYD